MKVLVKRAKASGVDSTVPTWRLGECVPLSASRRESSLLSPDCVLPLLKFRAFWLVKGNVVWPPLIDRWRQASFASFAFLDLRFAGSYSLSCSEVPEDCPDLDRFSPTRGWLSHSGHSEHLMSAPHLCPTHPVQVLIRLLTTHPLHPPLYFFQDWELPSGQAKKHKCFGSFDIVSINYTSSRKDILIWMKTEWLIHILLNFNEFH